jgi:RNA polymerase sigma factor (sigma-70 family)
VSAFPDTAVAPDTIDRARSGDRRAQEAIYRAFERPVRTLARRLVARAATAEDLAQDVFVDVLTRLDQYDGRGSFAGWLRSITVRRCLMHLRSPWRRGVAWIEAPAGPDDHVSDRQPVAGCGDSVDLERALARLDDVARAVVWLHDVEGYTHAEIGELLGGTPSLSKSRLARAHARLRDLLDRDGVKESCMPVSSTC